MRSALSIFLLLSAAMLIPSMGLAQGILPPVPLQLLPPNDPLEPVTGEVQQVTTAEQRAALRILTMRASSQYQMHAKDTPAHILQIAFTATASTSFPAAAGQLRETWISGQNWRWDATLGAYSLLRISSNGVAYDQQAIRPIPLRLKMLANAVFAPVQGGPPIMRTAQATWNGAPVTCILHAYGGGDPRATPTTGRQWNELEYCIDPGTARLMMFSEAPGIYVAYDYTNALRFHDRLLPGSLTVTENGAAVLRAQLTSIADTDPANLAPFTPTAEMKAQGPAVVLGGISEFTQIVNAADIQAGAPIQPAVVHVTFDEAGAAQEAELLQTNGMSARALDHVTHMKIWAAANPPGAPPRQREAYITVEFVPQPQRGVPMMRPTAQN
jgi:hypothetical protein